MFLSPLEGHIANQDTLTTNSKDIEVIETYFTNFSLLAKAEKWEEILAQGKIAIEAAKKANRPQDEAKIYAQLTSTSFYLGDYTQSLIYANYCHKLSGNFVDPSLLIRALYLESAVHRALASKKDEEFEQQVSYLRAIEFCEEASRIYSEKNIDNKNLQGKIFLNLGAAHADNPKGDLTKAMDCYYRALECFKSTNAVDDIIRINIRLGKVHFMQKNYDLSQKIIDEVRPLLLSRRLAMQMDYLEAQLKAALRDNENAKKIARRGLETAKELEAKEDELRLTSLLQTLENL